MNELLKKFSDELKSRREELGISLEEIHSKYRIDIKFLKAIEDCEFNILPDIYIKAFIKSYAQAVDLDYIEVLKNFDSAKKGKSEEKPSKPKEEKKVLDDIKDFEIEEDYKPEQQSKSKNNSNTIIIVSAIILIGILTAVYFFYVKNTNNIIIKENSIEEVTNESENRFEVEDKSNQTNGVAKDSLVLNIKALDSSWIKVVRDSRDTLEFILLPRREKEIKASQKFELMVGNSGGIELFMNKTKLNFGGKKGEVKNVMIDNNGIYNVK